MVIALASRHDDSNPLSLPIHIMVTKTFSSHQLCRLVIRDSPGLCLKLAVLSFVEIKEMHMCDMAAKLRGANRKVQVGRSCVKQYELEDWRSKAGRSILELS